MSFLVPILKIREQKREASSPYFSWAQFIISVMKNGLPYWADAETKQLRLFNLGVKGAVHVNKERKHKKAFQNKTC